MVVVEVPMEQYSNVPTSEKNEKGPELPEPAIPAHTGWGVRHSQLVLFTITLCVSFIARAHMGVTMVAMTRHRDSHGNIDPHPNIADSNIVSHANIADANIVSHDNIADTSTNVSYTKTSAGDIIDSHDNIADTSTNVSNTNTYAGVSIDSHDYIADSNIDSHTSTSAGVSIDSHDYIADSNIDSHTSTSAGVSIDSHDYIADSDIDSHTSTSAGVSIDSHDYIADSDIDSHTSTSAGVSIDSHDYIADSDIDSHTSTSAGVTGNGNDTEWMHEANVTIERFEDGVETIYRSHEWGKPVQEMVLSAFFLGYALMMFPMGLVCQRWGGKLPLQISMLVNGLVSAIMPWLALWGGWKAVCACRVVQGGAQAGTYPSLQVLLAKWVPASEKATLSSYLYTGTTIGTVIGFQLSGVLSSLGGWPVTFWAVGGLCLASLALLSFLGAASPGDHATISQLEANYIRGRIVYTNDIKVRRKTPWKAIFTCKPMWANFATHIGSIAAFNFMLTQVPSYIHYILNVDVKNSGLLSSLPYVASLVPSLGLGVVSDYLTNNHIVSVDNARRISNSISQIGVAASLIAASFATNTTLCVLCFVITICCHTGIHAGWMVNHIDLAPNFSATMMALGNTMSNLVVVLLPVVVSYVVTDVTNVFQWRIMLSLVAAMCFLTNIVFVVFISTDVQPWNEGALEDDPESDEISEKIKNK